jgi:hypothetical protein
MLDIHRKDVKWTFFFFFFNTKPKEETQIIKRRNTSYAKERR